MIHKSLRSFTAITFFLTFNLFWFCQSFRAVPVSRTGGAWQLPSAQLWPNQTKKQKDYCTEAAKSCVLSSPQGGNYEKSFRITKCKYGDLRAVSEIIFDSFYNEQMRKSPFSAFLKMKELERLQSNYPYNSENHQMFVAIDTATTEDRKVIGFADIDDRPATRRIDPPRPYMSDLVVHADYRQQGIARTLIETCENLVQEKLSNDEMYIRVERDNVIAVQMYEKIDYIAQQHDIFGVEDTTVLLHKKFEIVNRAKTS